MPKKYLFFIILATSLMQSYAQTDSSQNKWEGIGIESNFWISSMLKHASTFTSPIEHFTTAFELNILQQTTGKKDWHIRRNYPLVGLGFMYFNFNNPTVYGYALGVYPHITIPLIKRNRWQWDVRVGMGIGYFSTPFDIHKNAEDRNVAIGSHFVNVSPFSSNLLYRFNKNWNLLAGFQFGHLSNGAIKAPNLGINLYGGHIGVRYWPSNAEPQKTYRELPHLSNRWLFQLRGSIGLSDALIAGGPMYRNYFLSAFVSKRYISKNKALLGIDAIYYPAVWAKVRAQEEYKGKEWQQAYNLAVFAGNEFLIGRLGVVIGVGVYFKNYYKQIPFLYEKIGGNFYIIQNEKGILKELYASVLLKAHLGRAEMFEMGLGIGL